MLDIPRYAPLAHGDLCERRVPLSATIYVRACGLICCSKFKQQCSRWRSRLVIPSQFGGSGRKSPLVRGISLVVEKAIAAVKLHPRRTERVHHSRKTHALWWKQTSMRGILKGAVAITFACLNACGKLNSRA